MDVDNIEDFKKLSISLNGIVHDFLIRSLPLRRILLVAAILKQSNIKISNDEKLIDRILSEQKEDGGWVDCEDTAWALSYLSGHKNTEQAYINGLKWLENEKAGQNAWGFCARDNPCIPITGQILYFLPIPTSLLKAVHWLEHQWQIDFNAPVNLNYKGAWYLLAYYRHHKLAKLTVSLYNETIDYLIREQRDSGSWGPWRDHPAPEDCFITGICMAALGLSYSISGNRKIIPCLRKSFQWIKTVQMANGLFPTHYIEEGSAWILFGWHKAIMILKNIDE
jgi:hypothetical protein